MSQDSCDDIESSPDEEQPVKDAIERDQAAHIGQQSSPARATIATEAYPAKPRQDPNSNTNPSCDMSAPGSGSKSFCKRLKEPISIFTGMLVGIGLLQVFAFVESERASVIPTEARFAKESVAHDPTVAINIEIKNGGKSTATIEVLHALIGHALPPEPDYREGAKFAIAPILPNGAIERRLEFRTEWGQDYVTRLNNGTLPLFFYGRIHYRDEFSDLLFFGGERQTAFCFRYVPTGGVKEPGFETCQERQYTYTR